MLHRATTFGVPLESAALRVRLFAGANILLQVALGLAGVAAWRALGFTDRGGWWPLLAAMLAYAPVMAAAGAVLAGVTLLVARMPPFRVHLEVLFAAAGCQDMKAFLRMHISEDGELEVFAVAVEQVCHRWRLEPEADDPEASWLAPEPLLTPRLVERIRLMGSEAERHVAIR